MPVGRFLGSEIFSCDSKGEDSERKRIQRGFREEEGEEKRPRLREVI